jgi:hypothetical protein
MVGSIVGCAIVNRSAFSGKWKLVPVEIVPYEKLLWNGAGQISECSFPRKTRKLFDSGMEE